MVCPRYRKCGPHLGKSPCNCHIKPLQENSSLTTPGTSAGSTPKRAHRPAGEGPPLDSELPMVPTRSENRRAWTRYACDLRATCRPEVEESYWRWPAQVCDISCGGVRLCIYHRFDPGAVLQLELDGSDELAPKLLRARVLYVEVRADGHWLHGCRFESGIRERDLARLLSLYQVGYTQLPRRPQR